MSAAQLRRLALRDARRAARFDDPRIAKRIPVLDGDFDRLNFA